MLKRVGLNHKAHKDHKELAKGPMDPMDTNRKGFSYQTLMTPWTPMRMKMIPESGHFHIIQRHRERKAKETSDNNKISLCGTEMAPSSRDYSRTCSIAGKNYPAFGIMSANLGIEKLLE
jgi:hypothetical protein